MSLLGKFYFRRGCGRVTRTQWLLGSFGNLSAGAAVQVPKKTGGQWAARRATFRDTLPRPTRLLIGHQNGVDHVNHAIRLVDVGNRNRRHSALFVGQHNVLAMKAGLQRSAADGLQSSRS